MDIKLSNSIGLCCLVLGFTFLCRVEPKMNCMENCSFFNNSIVACQKCILGNFSCSTCQYWTKNCWLSNISSTVSPTTFRSNNSTTSLPILHTKKCTENCNFICVSHCEKDHYAQNHLCQPCSGNCTHGCEGNADNCTISSVPAFNNDSHEIVAIVVPIVVIVIIIGLLIVVLLLWQRQFGTKQNNTSKPAELVNNKKKDEEQGMLRSNCAAKSIDLVQDLENSHDKTRYATDPTMFRKVDEAISTVDSDGEQDIYVNVPSQNQPSNECVVDKFGRPSSEEQIAQLPSPPPIPVVVKANLEPESWSDFNVSIDGIVDTEEIYHLPQAPPLPVFVNTSQTKDPPVRTVPEEIVKVPEEIVKVPVEMDEIYENVVYNKQKPCEDENHYYSEDPLTEEMYENLQSKDYYYKR